MGSLEIAVKLSEALAICIREQVKQAIRLEWKQLGPLPAKSPERSSGESVSIRVIQTSA